MTEKLSSAAGRVIGLMVGASTLVGPLVGLVIYFARIDPSISGLSEKVAELKLTQIEQRNRLDKIDESRNVGLQRLAKVEEVATSTAVGLKQINDKLDRILIERSRP